MVKLTINGKSVEAKEGSTILETANQARIHIPTLCFHESLSPAGACRVCVVEVATNGKSSLTTACTYPVQAGLTVRTDSETVISARKLAVELLMAQRPHSAEIMELARELGIEKPSFTLAPEECILCQLCVRTCHEVVGVDAITFITQERGRGEAASIEHSKERCIGCGSCAYICPTEAITMLDVGADRTINTPSRKLKFKLLKCRVCGTYWAPEKQIEYIARISGTKPEEYNICTNCRD